MQATHSIGTIEEETVRETLELRRAYERDGWVVDRDLLHLRLTHLRYDLQLELMMHGFGASTLRLGGRSFVFFADGHLKEADPGASDADSGSSLASQRKPLPEGPIELGYLVLVSQSSGPISIKHTITGRSWTIDPDLDRLSTSAPGKVDQSFLEILEADFHLRCKLRDEPVTQSVPQEAPNTITEPPPAETPQSEDDSNRLVVTGRDGRKLSISVPFEWKPEQRKIMELLAEYGQLSESSLRKRLNSRRARSIVEDLCTQLYACGMPFILKKGDTSDEGRLYGFDYQVIEGAEVR